MNELTMTERRDGWVSLSQVAAWIMSITGGVFVLLIGGFLIYIADTIGSIRINLVSMSKDTQYVQLQMAKFDVKLDQLTDRVAVLETRRALIGNTPHE